MATRSKRLNEAEIGEDIILLGENSGENNENAGKICKQTKNNFVSYSHSFVRIRLIFFR